MLDLFTMLRMILILLFAALAPPEGSVPAIKQNDEARIDAILHEYGYDRPDAPGVSLIVIKDGKTLYKKAYGLADVEAKLTNTTRTNFRLASITKPFTAMAILILMEQGKLSLESRLTDFFPDFPAYGRAITVRHLLNHTSGLPDYVSLVPTGQEDQLKDKDVLRILQQQRDGYFLPGAKFEYSNSGYALLALIVEKVSGLTFAQFLATNIFQPLGMSDTVAYEAGISSVKNRAFGYTAEGSQFHQTDQSLTSAVLGDGGIYSSVEDMYRWDQALYTTKLVRADTLKQAFTSGTYGNGQTSGYGFGWAIENKRGLRKVEHGGGTVGFRNHILRLPDQKFTVVVLMNRSDGSPNRIATKIARHYYPALVAPQPRIADVPPAVLNTFAGYYDVRGNVNSFTARTGRLFWGGISATPLELLPLSRDTFFYADADLNPERNWRLTFVKDAHGQMKQMVYKADGKEVFKAPYLGPLMHTLTAQPDPDPTLTQTVMAILKAFVQGGKAVEEVSSLMPDVKKARAAHPLPDFTGLQSLTFLAAQETADRGIERYGGKVSRILSYKMVTDKATRYVMIYLTADGLIADADAVDD